MLFFYTMKRSPIYYMGSKRRLINTGMLDYFPENIDTFVDAFVGSCSVSLNVRADNYIVNDRNPQIIELIKMFKDEEVIEKIYQIKEEFDLTGTEISKEKEKAYLKLRDTYNTNREPIYLYTLLVHCFCNQMRFNADGDFNMPFGNRITYSYDMQMAAIGFKKWLNNNNIQIFNGDYRELPFETLTRRDFVYLDPPYFNTTATYNERDGGWTWEDEQSLLNLCEELDQRGIRWAMSNVFESKGVENTHLVEWSKKYHIEHMDINYAVCGKDNSGADEVLIMNYQPPIEQLSLF